MKYYLKTKEECDTIVANNDAFISKTAEVEGCNVVIYDYRLASTSDFFPKDKDNNTELRGLCFVEQTDGTWKRNILLNKFFNINQTTLDNLYELELEDGTLLELNENDKVLLVNGKEKLVKDLNDGDDININTYIRDI